MLDENIKQKVLLKLGIDKIHNGTHYTKEDEAKPFGLKYLWIAVASAHYKYSVVLAVMRTTLDCRGFIALRPDERLQVDFPFELLQEQHSRYVQIERQHDQVFKALRMINAVSGRAPMLIDDGENYDFGIEVHTPALEIRITQYRGPNLDPTLDRLWKALVHTTRYICNVYQDNPEANYIRQTWRGWYWS